MYAGSFKTLAGIAIYDLESLDLQLCDAAGSNCHKKENIAG